MDLHPPPANWAKDTIGAFVDDARNNTFASFQKCPGHYQKLVSIDSAFRVMAEHLLNPQHLSDAFFLLKSHSSFLGSAHLSMAGQVPEAFMLMRGSLESSLYALHIHQHPDAAAVWANREDSKKAREKCRNEFGTGKVMSSLKAVSEPIHAVLDQLYQKTIDAGGHPNIGSLALMWKKNQQDDRTHFELAYLTKDADLIKATMKCSAQTGVCSLMVFRHVFPERFDILGLTNKLDELKSGL